MIKIGMFIQPGGPYDIGIKSPFYNIRYNHNKGYNSNKVLGLQVLINFLGSYMWINIDESWLCQSI